MKATKSLKVLYFIIPLSFVLGLSWGIHFKKNKIQTLKEIQPKAPKITLALPYKFLSKKLIEDFKIQTGVDVEVLPLVEESDYLKSILNNRDKLDLILVQRQLLPNIEKIKLIKEHNFKKLRQYISADFLNLNYDKKNKKYIPFAWNFYEIAYNSKKIKANDLNLNFLLQSKTHNKLVDFNFSETYQLLKKTQLLDNEWISTHREDLIESAIDRLLKTADFKKIEGIDGLTEKYDWIYTSHVQAQKLTNTQSWQTQIPEERSNINILLWGKLKQNKQTDLFIKYVLDHHELLLQNSNYATTLKSSNLPDYQKSSYIRSQSLLKLEMTETPQITEGIWAQSYKRKMPLDQQTSASNIANY